MSDFGVRPMDHVRVLRTMCTGKRSQRATVCLARISRRRVWLRVSTPFKRLCIFVDLCPGVIGQEPDKSHDIMSDIVLPETCAT